MRILGSFVKNCVKWSQNQLEEARIDAYSHLPTLLDLARSCKRLKLLRIGTRSNLHVEAMLQIMTLCSSLESFHVPMPLKVDYLFSLPNAARLKSVFMGIPPTGVDFLQIFPVPMSNLTRLYLHVPSERRNMVNIDLRFVSLHPSSIEPEG